MPASCHLCLLDDSPITALTPLLDPAIPSDRVIFAIRPGQLEDVQRLKKVLQPRGIRVDTWPLPDTQHTATLIDSFHQLIDQCVSDAPETQFVLNASCGPRHHILAAYEVARAYSLHCFVIEPELDELYWLYPENRTNSNLADRLRLRDYFTALDFTVARVANSGLVDKQLRDLGEHWLAQADTASTAMGQLNYLASTANEGQLTTTALTTHQANSPALQGLIDDLEQVGLVSRRRNALKFPDEAARFFANGGWLEEYVYGLLLSLRPQIPRLQDCVQGMEISRDIGRRTVSNELDVVALANNRLHIIECKTKKFSKGEGNDVIYKLDSLAELMGGTHARALLVSFKDIRLGERTRAAELDIEIIGPAELPQLKRRLRQWLQEA